MLPTQAAAPQGHNAGKKKGAAPKAGEGGDASRGLPPPPKAKGPLMENGKPQLENLAQHLLAFSYVAGKLVFLLRGGEGRLLSVYFVFWGASFDREWGRRGTSVVCLLFFRARVLKKRTAT